MELKERLMEALKNKYGIENEEDFRRAMEEQPGIDLGIFVTRTQKREVKSA